MKKLTNKTTITTKATMILLLAATAATATTPRSLGSAGRPTGSMGSHSMPGHSAGQPHVNMAPAHQGPSGMTRPHNTPGMTQSHTPAHTQPHSTPHSAPHSTPNYSPHSTPGGHAGSGFHGAPAHGGYVSRTHIRGGMTYVNHYRPYHFRGVEFHAYRPMHFFAPRFYGWMDSPWAFRVHYRWGWFGSPWYYAYRGYFTPYAFYSSPAYWLTDYLVATSLEESYQAGMIAYSGRYGMSEPVKLAIAAEVRRQIILEKAEAAGYQSATPTFLDGQSHVFVVTNPTTANAGNMACSLTGGDVVQLDGNAQVNGASATVQVVASKGNDCATGSYIGVTLAQLQEMQNGMRETVDQGMTSLQAQQGQNGLPATPAGM
jgi:hypothetical protein